MHIRTRDGPAGSGTGHRCRHYGPAGDASLAGAKPGTAGGAWPRKPGGRHPPRGRRRARPRRRRIDRTRDVQASAAGGSTATALAGQTPTQKPQPVQRDSSMDGRLRESILTARYVQANWHVMQMTPFQARHRVASITDSPSLGCGFTTSDSKGQTSTQALQNVQPPDSNAR